MLSACRYLHPIYVLTVNMKVVTSANKVYRHKKKGLPVFGSPSMYKFILKLNMYSLAICYFNSVFYAFADSGVGVYSI